MISYDAWKLATPPEYEREDESEAVTLWHAGGNLIADLMRAIERAEKGNDDEQL
jgi:hypothetical protein